VKTIHYNKNTVGSGGRFLLAGSRNVIRDFAALITVIILLALTSVTGNAASIARIDASWYIGLTGYTVPAGSDRLLVFVSGFENSADTDITGVTYGGVAMTEAVGYVTTASGYMARCEIWYMKEANIPSGSNNFVVTYASGSPSDPMHAAATFQNVNQTNPIQNTAYNQSSTGYNPGVDPITATVNVVGSGMAIAGAVCGNSGSYTWGNGWTKGSDQTSGATTTMSTANHAASAAGTDTASADHSSTINRQVIVVASLSPQSACAFSYRKLITIDRSKVITNSIAFDAASSYDTDDQYGAGNVGNSLTWSHTVSGRNRILIVGVSINNTAGQTVLNPGGVTYAGVALTQIGVGSRTNAHVEMWYLIAPSTGTNNVVVTLSGGATARFVVGAVSFTNVDQTSPLGTFQSANNSTATASVTVTSAPGELVVGALAKRISTEGATVGAGQTEYWNRVTSNATATNNEWGAGSTKPGATSVIISWTFSTSRPWAVGAVPLKPVSTFSNFPMLFSVTDSNLAHTDHGGHVTNENGWDIIFRALDDPTCAGGAGSAPCTLDHEIEEYNHETGKLVAWVRIPSLKTNAASSNTQIYVYYGNSCISEKTENPTGVWDSNYMAVWHLNQTTGGAGAIKDSTSNNNSGTDNGSPTLGATGVGNGKTGYCIQFDGIDDHIAVPSSTSLKLGSGLTIEAWININVWGDWKDIVFKGGGNAGDSDYQFALVSTGLAWDGTYAGNWRSKYFNTTQDTGTWIYAVVTHDTVTVSGYRDGSLISAQSDNGAIYESDYMLAIGREGAVSSGYIDGRIDEVRISNVARQADWIQTQYNNQSNPGDIGSPGFYTVGGEEGTVPTAVDLVSFRATGQGASVLVEWETAQEISNLGFNLYRMTGTNGSFIKLNSDLIPGLISSIRGRKYSYTDIGVIRGALYYYMLEDVDLSGKVTTHGLVCVDWDNDGIADDQEKPDDHGGQANDEKDKTGSGSEADQVPAEWTPSPGGESAGWVKVENFRALQQADGVSLEWVTSFEADNLGFNIYREQDGKYYRVTADLVPGSVFNAGARRELTGGQRYIYFDAISELTGQESYWLDCVGLDGARASFGPIKPEMGGKPIPERLKARFQSIARRQVSRQEELGKILELRKELKTKEAEIQASRAVFSSQTIISQVVPGSTEPRLPPNEAQWVLAAKPALKISVKEEGWYRVGQTELVAAGLDPLVDPRYLQLYVDGEEQSMMVTGSSDGRFDPEDAIEFYGRGFDTAFTNTRVYWLVVGSRPGRRLDTPITDIRMGLDLKMLLSRGLRGRGAPLSFPYSVEFKERTFYFPSLKNGEEDSFFGSLVYNEPVDQLINVPHPDSSAPDDAKLELVLQGATDFSHQVKILFNNQDAGLLVFSGQQRDTIEIEIPHGLILEGENIVTLEPQGGDEDVSLVDYIRLTYWRTYTADEDILKFTAMGTEWISIGGFSTEDIRVVDITDPSQMFEVQSKVNSENSGYTITVKVPGHGQRTLLAFTDEKIKQPTGIAANIPSSWHETTQGADVVIISSRDFLDSLRPLKELREQQGLSVVVVDVEDLYDEFNFGLKSPWPLREFLSRTYERWVPVPRFVLLVGDASYDPRNYLGFGNFDFVLTKFVDTEYIKTASDDWFVDFDDDGLPNMAVGRLPVDSVDEAETVVSKIISYESAAGFMNEALLVADANDSPYDFEASSAAVAALLPQNMTVRQILRGQNPAARTDLLNLLNQGQLFVNYIGHGSTEIWKGNLLTSSDASDLTNSPYLPLLVSMTCLNGFFQDPASESMAETFLKAKNGGAVGVWASSGLTYPPDQLPLDLKLIQLLFSGQGLTIGEAVVLSKQAVNNMDVRKTWILFGDPTTRLR
jgi:hypothetical protein